jgi:hypothetical protein
MHQGHSSTGKTVIKIAAVVLLLTALAGGIVTAVYYKRQYEAAKSETEVTKDLIEKVSKIINLPVNEDPTVATISDISKLTGQPFFTQAQNGDKVLIYAQAKKAYLYRPSTNKIVDVTVLSVADSTKTATPSAKQNADPTPIRVVLLNGTTTAGLTAAAEKKLAGVNGVSVSARGNAKSATYTSTSVVNVSGISKTAIDAIATAVGGTVDSLPTGEAKPDADVLIILSN